MAKPRTQGSHAPTTSKPWKGDSSPAPGDITPCRNLPSALPVHLVFSTKHREPLILDDVQARLYEYIGGTLRAQKSRLLASGGMPDHVHLLVLLSKEAALADCLP